MTAEEIQKQINDKEKEIKALKAQKEALQNERNQNPVDTWVITTEGDCEGKSVKSLGTFTGHLGDILLKLHENAYYTYGVKRASVPIGLGEDVRDSAELNTVVPRFHDLPFGDQDVAGAQKFFGPEFLVVKGKHYRSMRITRRK